MTPSTALKILAFSLTALSAWAFAAAAEERPRMEDYPSSYAFLQALESWNKAHPNGAPAPKPAVATKPAPQIVLDPTSELAPPPFEVTGPESLDTAVEKAKDIDHPAYKEKIRYHRSTHLSFPLPSIDGQDMSQASVSDTLSLQGKTDAEQKAELKQLTERIEQDQLRQTTQALDEGNSPAGMMSKLSEAASYSGPRAKVEISVTSH